MKADPWRRGVAPSAILGRPRDAPPWAVGERTPPKRARLRLCPPVGPCGRHLAQGRRDANWRSHYGLGGPVATWAKGGRLGRTGGWLAAG